MPREPRQHKIKKIKREEEEEEVAFLPSQTVDRNFDTLKFIFIFLYFIG
jgi:hypothetical protein